MICDNKVAENKFLNYFAPGRPSFLLSETDGRGYVEIKKLPLTSDNDPSYDSVSENESVKVENLENCQVKIDGNEVDEKIYEPMSEFSLYKGLKANSSFLWSNRRKNSENHENSSTINQGKDVDENTYEEFDDIGTSFEVIHFIIDKLNNNLQFHLIN